MEYATLAVVTRTRKRSLWAMRVGGILLSVAVRLMRRARIEVMVDGSPAASYRFVDHVTLHGDPALDFTVDAG